MIKKRASIRISPNGQRIIGSIQDRYPHLDRTGAIEHALVEWERVEDLEERVEILEKWMAEWHKEHTPGR